MEKLVKTTSILGFGSLVTSALCALPAAAHAGAVFTSDNATGGNHVVVFDHTERGALVPAGSIATGGTGTGAGLGSQGAVALADGGRVLLVVNAGSNDVSSFVVDGSRLRLRSRVASGGAMPISVGAHGRLVYVLNAGGDGNVSGFRIADDGALVALAGSTRALGADASGPAQVAIAPDGAAVVVTEKSTNAIDIYRVREDGLLDAAVHEPSVGETPFGFAFAPDGALIVSEAFGGAAGAGAVSSYDLDGRHADELSPISPSVGDEQAAPCWIAIGGGGRYAYTTNAGSNSISTYRVRRDGALELVGAPVATATHPTDEAVAGDALFVVANGAALQAFDLGRDGQPALTSTASVPAGSVGVAAN